MCVCVWFVCRTDLHLDRLQLPTVVDYFRYIHTIRVCVIKYCVMCVYYAVHRELYNRIVVTFIDKNLPGDTGVTLTLNQRMSYTVVCIRATIHSVLYIYSVCICWPVLYVHCMYTRTEIEDIFGEEMLSLQMAKEVASILGTDMYHLQFFRPQG